MGKWCDEGETNVGNIYLKNQAQNAALYLGLYKDTTEPAETAILVGLTEPSGYGYARMALSPGDWAEGPQGTFVQPEKIFMPSGGAWGNVYGYFVCTVATGTAGKLLGVEHFSTPYNVQAGYALRISPEVAIG